MIQNKNLQKKTIKYNKIAQTKKPYKTVCSSYVQIIIKKCIEQSIFEITKQNYQTQNYKYFKKENYC